MNIESAKVMILREWMSRPADKRKESDASIFSIEHAHPEAPYQFRCSGDKYQRIMGWISNYIVS